MTAIRGYIPATGDRSAARGSLARSTSSSRFPISCRRSASTLDFGLNVQANGQDARAENRRRRSPVGAAGRGQAQAPASSVVRLLPGRPSLPSGARRSDCADRCSARFRKQRLLAARSVRAADRGEGGAEDLTRTQDVRHLVVIGRGRGRSPVAAERADVRPRRLSHVLVFTPDIDKAIEFYSRNLGLRLSDRSDQVAFLHAIHGSDHHVLAFAKSDAPGLHHCSWDMGSIDEIGLGAMNMAAKGHEKGWGLGRHVLGSNYFHYVRDPWGSYAEYSCDIDYIPASRPWEAKYPRAGRLVFSVGPRAAVRLYGQPRSLTVDCRTHSGRKRSSRTKLLN